MSEKEENKQEQQENQQDGQSQDSDNLMKSITSAFNMGVATNQSSDHLKSVTEISAEMGHQIYDNLYKAYGDQYEEQFLIANTEYLLKIALLGFILPSVCTPDKSFRDKLFSLLESSARKTSSSGSTQSGGSDRSDNKIIY